MTRRRRRREVLRTIVGGSALLLFDQSGAARPALGVNLDEPGVGVAKRVECLPAGRRQF